MTDIATFTNDQLIAVCRADVAEMSKFLKDAEFSNPSRAALYLRITEIALAALTAKPVAWDYEWASCITCEGPQNFKRVIEREAPPEWAVDEGQAKNIIPLYRCAQQALVELHDRQSFESWYGATCGLAGTDLETEFNRDDAGEYIYSGAADAWKAWKASRAAIHHYAEKAVLHETD